MMMKLSLVVLVVLAWIQATPAHAQFNAQGKNYVLHQHNALRSRIALGTYVVKNITKPPATNMPSLQWDETLEKSAQTYAETCPTTNSKNRANTTGENLYWWFSNVNVTGNPQQMGASSANTWSNEFGYFGWPSNNFTSEQLLNGIGHAIQMAWVRTRFIGCGLARCPVPDTFPGQVWAVVCQYEPKYILNQEVYESGTTCTKCPKRTECQPATGLCVPVVANATTVNPLT